MTEPTAIQIIISPDFQAQTRKLAKRYRSIRADLQPFLDEIQSGNFTGDRMTNTGAIVFKACLLSGAENFLSLKARSLIEQRNYSEPP